MIDAAPILRIVAGVIDRRDDKAGIGKSCRSRMVAPEPATATVRDHDKRQFITVEGAVPRPLDDPVSDGCLLLRRAAWVPDGPSQRSAVGVGWCVEEPNASGLGRHGSEAQGE